MLYIVPYIPLTIIALICGLISWLLTRWLMPHLIKRLEKANIVGKDIHKSTQPIIAEMGGLGILFGVIIGIFTGIILHPPLSYELSVVLVVILLVGIIGIVDDLLALKSKEKLILLFIAGLPLVWIAPPGVGILYMISIPIIVSIASNLTNMLAGLNGIESGLGVISMTSLTICCIILGKYDVTILSMSMLGALIAFLHFNKAPAKVFPGDTGTLIIGANIAAIALIGRIKLVAFIIMLPNIIDAALKFYSAGVMNRTEQQPTQLNENEELIKPETGFKSLIRLVLRHPEKETNAVKMIWVIGIIFGIIGILVTIFMPIITGNESIERILMLKDHLYYNI